MNGLGSEAQNMGMQTIHVEQIRAEFPRTEDSGNIETRQMSLLRVESYVIAVVHAAWQMLGVLPSSKPDLTLPDDQTCLCSLQRQEVGHRCGRCAECVDRGGAGCSAARHAQMIDGEDNARTSPMVSHTASTLQVLL